MPMLSIGIDVSKGKSTVCGMKLVPLFDSTKGRNVGLVSLLCRGEEVRAVLPVHCPVAVQEYSSPISV